MIERYLIDLLALSAILKMIRCMRYNWDSKDTFWNFVCITKIKTFNKHICYTTVNAVGVFTVVP